MKRAFLALAASVLCASTLLADDYDKQYKERADFLIKATAARDGDAMIKQFEASEYFRNAGGDAHKYAMPVALAKLALNPNDEQGLRFYRYLQDVAEKKPDRALYHFATYPRARLYFQFGDKLPAWIKDTNKYDAENFMKVMVGNRESETHGTDNHATMMRLNGLLWCEHLGAADPGHKLHEDYKFLKGWAQRQVRKYYNVGMGEYDSSTYVGFTCASWANLYDFSPDPDTRKLAEAALHWQAATMATKYFHGLNAGPESRGFADQPVGNINEKPTGRGVDNFLYAATGNHTDWCSWLWFGNSARPVFLDKTGADVNPFPANVLAFSSYRPPAPIRNLATKNVKLPFEVRASKPTYYGMGDNKDQEYLYIADSYMMGTLYSGDDGIATTGTILPQTTMFKLAIKNGPDVVVFGMAQGYHKHYPVEGRGPFDVYHQQGNAAIMVTHVSGVDDIKKRVEEKKWPAPNLAEHAILAVPKGIAEPVIQNGWYFWQIGTSFVAAYPLGGEAKFVDLPERAKSKDKDNHRWLVSPGAFSGWVIQAGSGANFQDFGDFRAAMSGKHVGISKYDGTVTYTSLLGDLLSVRHPGKPGEKPIAATNRKPLVFKDWPVYESPFINQPVNKGTMSITDGKQILTIDINAPTPKIDLK